MNKYLYIFLFLCLAHVANAQKAADTTEEIAMNTVVHFDPRIDIVLKKHKSTNGVGGSGIYSGKGYRVQIYSGSDRNKASKMKIDFQRRFPGVHAYMTYASPRFRVKVGDFHTRAEAHELYSKLTTLYNPCMIVPDMVVFRNFNNQKEKDEKSNTE